MPNFRSDFGTDRWVHENYFSKGLLNPFGYAAGVGACDGVYADGTAWLEELGWIVLCVEPNPLVQEALRKERKLVRAVACGAEDREDVDYMACGGWPYASASGPGVDPRYVGQAPVSQTLKVTMRRLDRLLEEAGFPRLDYLMVDTEGHEREVMSGFTIERWCPTIMAIEDIDSSLGAFPDYEIVHRAGLDSIYVRT